MLSRREREFLTNPEKFTGSYARWLRYSIKRKIRKTIKDLELISQTWPQALENFPTPTVNVKEIPNSNYLTNRENQRIKPRAGFESATCGLQDRSIIGSLDLE